MHVHGARLEAARVEAPDALEQLLARDGAIGGAGQELQDLLLLLRSWRVAKPPLPSATRASRRAKSTAPPGHSSRPVAAGRLAERRITASTLASSSSALNGLTT